VLPREGGKQFAILSQMFEKNWHGGYSLSCLVASL